MSKTELVAKVEAAGLSKKDATIAVNTVFSAISDSLAEGQDVTLIGFGTFSVKERAARDGRNPATGEPMKIAATKVVGFKAGKTLKDRVK